MFEFRGLVAHRINASVENENQPISTKNGSQNAAQKHTVKKTAFGDLKNTLPNSATPSRKPMKSTLFQPFSTPKPGNSSMNLPNSSLFTSKSNVKVKRDVESIYESIALKPDNLQKSRAHMWIDELQIDRIFSGPFTRSVPDDEIYVPPVVDEPFKVTPLPPPTPYENLDPLPILDMDDLDLLSLDCANNYF